MRRSPLTPISLSPPRLCSISFALLAASLAAPKPKASCIRKERGILRKNKNAPFSKKAIFWRKVILRRAFDRRVTGWIWRSRRILEKAGRVIWFVGVG
ncbi:hypothetical protein YC2023_121445 [Brassica napus]